MVDQLINQINVKTLIEKAIGGRWNVAGSETIEDPNGKWCLAVVKKSDCYPLIGPKNKETIIDVFAMDSKGELQSKNFNTKSLSWIQNNNEIFPKINAWIFMMTKNNPNLQGV